MGSIFKRGGRFWIKYHRNGKCYRESCGSDKKMVAKKLLEIREGEIAQGKLPGIMFDKTTFDQLADGLCWDYRINHKKSLKRAEGGLKHLRTCFSGMKATNITTPVVQQYVKKRIEEGAANATINRELAALKRMLNLGAEQTPPIVDRVPHIPMLKEDNVRTGFFEHGDFIKLRKALPDHLKGFVTFAYKTGWRFDEIRQLTWDRVDLALRSARIDPGHSKNGKGRSIYLDAEILEVLRILWQQRKKSKRILPWVFLNPTGDNQIRDFRKSWATACKKVGIKGRLFHDFRRTAIRNTIRAGSTEKVALVVSGHKTRAVLDRYNIVDEQDLQLAAERQHAYLESRISTISGTVVDLNEKRSQPNES